MKKEKKYTKTNYSIFKISSSDTTHSGDYR